MEKALGLLAGQPGPSRRFLNRERLRPIPPGRRLGGGDNSYCLTNVPAGLSNVVAVAAGSSQSLALTAEGQVVAWGCYVMNVPAGLSNVVAVAAGDSHCLALTAAGRVVAWGDNRYGQMNVPAGLSNVVAVAAGYSHSLALTAAGRVVSWGNNESGQTNVPAGLGNVVAVAAGESHSLALTATGRVVGWGEKYYGETTAPAGLSNVVAVAAGGSCSLALTTEGKVVGWGNPGYGQLNVPTGLSNVVAVAVGDSVSLALTVAGRVVSWGYDYHRQTNVPAALSNVVAIAAGYSHSLALTGPPSITLQPQSQTAALGTTATFQASAVGFPPLSYQWLKDGLNLSNTARVTGATSNSLRISNLKTNDGGAYTVVVTNPSGAVTSRMGVLTVVITPPSVTVQPQSQTVVAGTTASFQATAAGALPLSYQWRKDGTNLDGANGTCYSIASVQASDAGGYTLVATNLAGAVTSAVARLTVLSANTVTWNQDHVLGPSGPHPHAGIYQFTDLIIGDNVEVTSSNISQLVLRVEGTLLLRSNAVIRVRNGFYEAAPEVSLTNFTVENLNLLGTDAGGFRVYLNAFGKGGNGGAGSPWNYYSGWWNCGDGWGGAGGGGGGGFGGGEGGINDSLTGEPNGGKGSDGGLTRYWPGGGSFSRDTPGGSGGLGGGSVGVGQDGPAPPYDQWGTGCDLVFGGAGGGGGNGGTAPWATSHGGGVWTYGGGGGGYGGGILTIIADTVLCGTEAAPHFLVSGQQGGLGGKSDWIFARGQDGEGGMLIIQARQYNPSSNHWGLGSSTYGSHAASAINGGHGIVTGYPQKVFVLPPSGPPFITRQPVSQTNAVGSVVVFGVAASGTPPLTYQWFLNGTNVAGAMNATLTLTSVQMSQAGDYRVVVTNTVASVTSQVATLTLFVAPPVILAPPPDTVARVGSTVSLSAVVGGSPPFQYQWYFNGTSLPGATNAMLVLHNVQTSEAGPYALAVRNPVGAVTSSPPALMTVATVWIDLINLSHNRQAILQLNGEAGQAYEVQASANLGLTNWTTIATLTNVTGTMPFTDPATNFPQRFYRLHPLP